MKTKCLIVLLVAFVLGFTTFSYAQGRGQEGVQNIDQRVKNAHDDIERGIYYTSFYFL